MKVRKVFAWLMTLVMLLGMVPAGHAEVIDCDHNWAWRWPDGQPTNCQDWKWSEEYCTLCGEGNGRFEQCGPCQPGEKHWVTPQPTNCYECGTWEITCKFCGEWMDGQEVPGSHNWVTQTGREPTCTEPGYKETVCSTCGSEQGNPVEIPALGHDMGEWHWAHGNAATCTEGAWQVRECKRCNHMEDKWVEAGGHKWGPETLESAANCIKPGVVSITCSVCGAKDSWETDYGSHNWSGWNAISTGDCVNPAKEQRTCSICNKTETRDGSYGSHNWGEWKVTKQGDCLNNGEEQRTCSICGKSETRQTGGGGHKMGYWYRSGVPTCTKEGMMRSNCEICGYYETEPIPATGHNMGEWYVVEAPQVGLPGIERRDCLNECGHYETRQIPELEQDFGNDDLASADGLELTLVLSSTPANGTHFVVGEEVVFTETWVNNTDKTLYPFSVSIFNCVEPVFGSEIDQICSWFAEDAGGPVVPGATGSHTLTVIVTEADVARGAIYAMAELLSTVQDGPDLENVTTPFATAPCGPGELPDDYVPPVDDDIDDDGVYLEKFIRNAPANGEYYVPGEVLNYALTLRIDDGLLLDDAAIYDPIIDNDGLVISYGKGLYGGMGMDVFYTVTEEDAQRGYVENTGYATWIYRENGESGRVDSNTVTVPCGPGELPEDYESPVNPDIDGDGSINVKDPTTNGTVTNDVAVIKAILNAPANGAYFVPGEEIVFDIAVHNNSTKTLDVVALTDPLSADFYHELLDIPGGAMDSRTLRYTVTEFDAEIGSVINYAYAVAYVDDQPMSLTSNSVTAPCGFPDNDGDGNPDEPFGIHTALEVVKSVESLPLNGSYYQKGETVAYKITYTNAGESVLTDVRIYDALSGLAEIASAEMLQPGESRSCFFNYTITEADVLWGAVSNTAVGQFFVHDYLNSVNSNTVTVDTNGQEDNWNIYDPWKPGDHPDYTPGTGWVEHVIPTPGDDIPEDNTPSFGTIDTDQLYGGAASCVRTITDRDNASVGYELSFCADHVDTQSSVLLMMQAANTPEMQMQTAAYAVVLWRSEVEALYEKLLASADPAAKATIMTEYIRFLTEISNYEALLKNLYPDQPALAAKKIAAMWEDKCVTLCYEMHTSVAQRKDSLLSVTPATGTVASECACTTTNEVNGKKAYTQSWCPVHGFPFSMIDMLLQGQDTAEAWTMVRQIWGVELTNAYNKLAAKLGANNGLVMAEYNALTQWMMAREASLIALYPEHPEVVAQTMVKLIMDRVNDLCQVAK